MALKQVNTTVGTTAVRVAVAGSGVKETQFTFCNNHTSDVHVGTSTVTTAQPTIGIRIPANGVLQLWLRAGEELYAVAGVAAATPVFTTVWSE